MKGSRTNPRKYVAGGSFYGMACAMRAVRHESASGNVGLPPSRPENAREKFLGIGVEMHVPRPT
jgi:hypothetical protein